MKIFITTLFILFQILSYAQEPTLIADLNPGSNDAFNDGRARTVTIDGTTLFTVRTQDTGFEIGYLNNGQIDVLKDIRTGPGNSDPRYLLDFKGLFYFTATSPDFSRELWVSDGTPDGTQIFGNGEDDNNVNGLMVSESELLYYYNGNTIFRTDGTSIDTVFDGARYSFRFQTTDHNICKYKEEVAFLTRNGVNEIELYVVEGDSVTLKATKPAGSGFSEIFGMNQVGDDILFIVSDPFDDEADGSFRYDAANDTIVPYQINGRNIIRMHDFTDELGMAYESQSGYYAVNGVAGEEVLLATAINVTLTQQEDIIRAVYQDKILLAAEQEFFGDYPILISDGTSAGTSDLLTGERNPPFSMMTRGSFVFFIYQSGFRDYTLAYVNMEDGTSGTVYEFLDQEFGFRAFPVGIEGNKIFFAADFVGGLGMELYSVDLDVNVSTSQPQLLPYNVRFTSENFTVQTDNTIPVNVEVFSATGALLERINTNTNTAYSLAHHNGLVFLRFNVDGVIRTEKFIRR